MLRDSALYKFSIGTDVDIDSWTMGLHNDLEPRYGNKMQLETSEIVATT